MLIISDKNRVFFQFSKKSKDCHFTMQDLKSEKSSEVRNLEITRNAGVFKVKLPTKVMLNSKTQKIQK